MMNGFLRHSGEVLKAVPDRQTTGRQYQVELSVNLRALCAEDPARWCMNAPRELLARTRGRVEPQTATPNVAGLVNKERNRAVTALFALLMQRKCSQTVLNPRHADGAA
jgi:hypothetical protein